MTQESFRVVCGAALGATAVMVAPMAVRALENRAAAQVVDKATVVDPVGLITMIEKEPGTGTPQVPVRYVNVQAWVDMSSLHSIRPVALNSPHAGCAVLTIGDGRGQYSVTVRHRPAALAAWWGQCLNKPIRVAPAFQ